MVEWNASDYQSISKLQEVMAGEQLARLTLQGNERILDMGCGNGKITAAIAAKVPQGQVLGIDPSQNMITFAQTHYAQSQPNLRFEVADARNLPYQNAFNLIVSFNALHWVTEQSAALHSLHQALEPTGKALLRFVPQGDRKCIEDVIQDICHSSRWVRYFPNLQKPYVHFTPDEYRILATQADLKVVQIDVEDKSWDFKSRQAFFAYCQVTLVEWTRFLPEAEQAAFITDVLDAYQSIAADTPAEANTFKFYQMEVLLTPAQ
ncbi:methyltransferase domain-containing protein [Kovacikia minuta CCNUW1]|uniref:class I SAM-dependent methyltransferase n=1 Tax=Kovacikia minuta TaxID=2931930 RepID=UPI001CCAF06E|nr:class I SAM-dependent methyltransferase [Kovacikia minuta]UBF27217.1 methyltransferase domain-containing protein [Kovacikia minuta CCNUW1]